METIGPYKILGQLGEGGMGSVLLAHDPRLGRRVAIKVMASKAPEPEQVARFEQEAQAIAALSHPNILTVFDFGWDEGRPYIAMELLEGRTLREVIDAGQVPARRAVAYGLAVAHGLAAAHAKGVLHRDLKPANVFVTDAGHVKIVDFGLAAVRQSTIADAVTVTTAGNTAPGTVLGTVGYMAPEQVRGETADHRSDIFAFGCLFFELLTGQRAFSEPTAIETMHAILRTEPPFERLAEVGVSEPLAAIVRRCLEKQPSERFQSARDLAFSIQTLLDGPRSGSLSGTSLSAAARAAAEQVRVRPPAIAVLPFTNLSNDPDMEYFSDGVTEDIINALARVPELRVAARTSCFAFKGKAVDLAEIGQRLKVESILEGSVRRAGTRLRVTTQLIDVSEGYEVWSERYDRELDDVFAIQDDIARNIVRHLRTTLGRGASSGAYHIRPATADMDAYDVYLQGRYLVEQRGDGIAKGMGLLQRAVAIDPEFALAYAAIAETLVLLAVYGVAKADTSLKQAQAAAARALSLDEALADAHRATALVRTLWEWDWPGAEAAFNQAITLSPNDAQAHYWKGLLLLQWVKGDHDAALAAIRKAVDLDPIGTIPQYALGLALVAAGQSEEAIALANQGLKDAPTSFLPCRVLGVALFASGRMDEAVAALGKTVDLSQRQPGALGEFGVALARAGRTDEARRIQQELLARAQSAYVSPIVHGLLAEALGERDAAVAYAEAARNGRDPLFLMAAVAPTAASLRTDERVRRLYREAGVESVA